MQRFLIILAGSFWASMLGLLCLNEFGSGSSFGHHMALDTIWEKVLTAPDNSALQVSVDGIEVGWCRWAPTILESSTATADPDDPAYLEGMIREITGYAIDVESTITLPGETGRQRFGLNVEFDPEGNWQMFVLRFGTSETLWSFHSDSREQFLEMKVEGEDRKWSQKFSFNQLQQPQSILGGLGNPFAAMTLGNMGLMLNQSNRLDAASAVDWSARYDRIEILNQPVRCYRVDGKILNRYSVTLYISRVGEIIRVELPNGIRLENDMLVRM